MLRNGREPLQSRLNRPATLSVFLNDPNDADALVTQTTCDGCASRHSLHSRIVVVGIKDHNTQIKSNPSNGGLRWIVVVVVAAVAAAAFVVIVSGLVVVEVVTGLMVVVVLVLVLVLVCVEAVIVLWCRRCCCCYGENPTKYRPFCAHVERSPEKLEKRNTTTAAMTMTTMADVADRLFLCILWLPWRKFNGTVVLVLL